MTEVELNLCEFHPKLHRNSEQMGLKLGKTRIARETFLLIGGDQFENAPDIQKNRSLCMIRYIILIHVTIFYLTYN